MRFPIAAALLALGAPAGAAARNLVDQLARKVKKP